MYDFAVLEAAYPFGWQRDMMRPIALEVGTRDLALAAGHGLPTLHVASRDWGGSPVPILAPLPLHRNAGRITDLDPDRKRTGSIGAVHPLRDDALGAKLASVLEHGRTVSGDVFI